MSRYRYYILHKLELYRAHTCTLHIVSASIWELQQHASLLTTFTYLYYVHAHGLQAVDMVNRHGQQKPSKMIQSIMKPVFHWFWQLHRAYARDLVIFVLTMTTHKLITLLLAHDIVRRVNIFTTNISRFVVVLFIIVLSLVHVKYYCLS